MEYSISALTARGYVSSGSLTVPVFGLYAGYENQVSVRLERTTNNPTFLKVTIPTSAYVDASGIYSRPNIVTARAAGTTLGFDFIYIKSGLGSPVINGTAALLVGLDSAHNVVFEFEYPTAVCNTSWKARPISFDDLRIDQ